MHSRPYHACTSIKRFWRRSRTELLRSAGTGKPWAAVYSIWNWKGYNVAGAQELGPAWLMGKGERRRWGMWQQRWGWGSRRRGWRAVVQPHQDCQLLSENSALCIHPSNCPETCWFWKWQGLLRMCKLILKGSSSTMTLAWSEDWNKSKFKRQNPWLTMKMYKMCPVWAKGYSSKL
jgi:hypothetical protein